MIDDKIRQIVAGYLEMDIEEITLDTSFDELGIDSSELVDLVITVENEFNTEIPSRKLSKFRTIGDIVRFVAGA